MSSVAPIVKRDGGNLALPSSPLSKIEALRETFARLEQQCNLIAPVASIDSIPAMHAISLRAVKIDANTNTYGQGPEVYRDGRFCQGDEVALGGVALQKIMAAAGVQVVSRVRVDDRSDPNYCDMEITLAVRDYDGTFRQVVAGKEVDLRDGAPETMKPEKDSRGSKTGGLIPLEQAALGDKRRHIQSLAESKALYRALRKILQLRQKYTRAELARPFVIPKLVPNLDPNDPDQKRALIAMATGAETRLFGQQPMVDSARSLPMGETTTTRDVTPHSATGDAARALPAQAPLEEAAPEQQPAQADDDMGDFDVHASATSAAIHVCTCACGGGCQAEISAAVAEVTTERVGAPRCRSCFPGKGFDQQRHSGMATLGLPKFPRMTPADAAKGGAR
jgi:hypothetical protein